MALPTRPGLTVPLPGHLHTHRQQLGELADLGYTDIWSAESDGGDGLTPLALAAAWEPRLRLGTAILPAFTRAPALMAQSAAALADAAPGRFALGIGTSSNVIVERWNGDSVRRAVQEGARPRALPARRVHGGEGDPRLRHVRDPRVPSRCASGTDATDLGRRPSRRHVAARRTRGRRGDHQLARTDRRVTGVRRRERRGRG